MKKPESEWHLTNDRPVFIQIMEKLKRDIVTGSYRPGDKLPSVRELAAEAAVNPNTMQRAFSELEREGLVYTKRTNGRFITEDLSMISQLKEQMALDAISQFLNSMQQLGFSGKETLALLKESLEEETA
jgi:DNA-binding transcriptional regulator YhcF (GntR family)